MNLTIKELFLNDGTCFSRLPLWIKNSFLIKTTYEIYLSGGEDETEPYIPPIDPKICTVPILNVIWNIMIGNMDLNGQDFNDVLSAANYMDIKNVMEELCNYFLNSLYVGKITDQPDYFVFTIAQKLPLLDFWWNSFMNAVNKTVREEWADGWEEIYRLWSPKLFWDTRPAIRRTCRTLYEPNILHGTSHYYLFWDQLVILPGIERLERFLWESGLFNTMALLPLPYELCPILGYSLEPITNEFSNSEIQRYQYYADRPPEWLLRVLQLIPNYLLHCPQEQNQSYSIIVKWIQCNFENYVDRTIHLVPNNYLLRGRSLLDYAADALCSEKIINMLFEHGHRPTQAIYSILLTIALIRRKFLTGWIYWLTSKPGNPVMSDDQLLEWHNSMMRFREDNETYIDGHEYALYRGNSSHIIAQLRQIYEWNIHKRQTREQFEGINLESLVLTE